MKVYKILYSRTNRDDYRWILQPPNDQFKEQIRDGIWKQYRSVARKYTDPRIPFLFGFAFGEAITASNWRGRLSVGGIGAIDHAVLGPIRGRRVLALCDGPGGKKGQCCGDSEGMAHGVLCSFIGVMIPN